MMKREDFLREKDRLRTKLLSTLRQHFEELGRKFDENAMIAETSVSFEDLISNAMVFGANITLLVEPTRRETSPIG